MMLDVCRFPLSRAFTCSVVHETTFGVFEVDPFLSSDKKAFSSESSSSDARDPREVEESDSATERESLSSKLPGDASDRSVLDESDFWLALRTSLKLFVLCEGSEAFFDSFNLLLLRREPSFTDPVNGLVLNLPSPLVDSCCSMAC